jgi:hypothetical protein
VDGFVEAVAICRTLVENHDSFANLSLLASLVTQLGIEYAELGKVQEESDALRF